MGVTSSIYPGADLGILRGGGGGGVRVQVHGNFHILTSKKKKKKNLVEFHFYLLVASSWPIFSMAD